MTTPAEVRPTVATGYSWARWVGAVASEPDLEGSRKRPAAAFGARYQVINVLGRGGMGVVSRALDRLTGRIVTLKQLKGTEDKHGSTSAAEARTQLAKEFRALASLRHPNVINVLDYGFDNARQPYLVMDLEENAQTIIEAGTDKPLAVRIDLLVQTLRALHYLHRLGIIHRDIKPDNILVVRSQVKVLDFGLSSVRESAEMDALGWAGTPAYMAPEVLRGGAPSQRSDLYAVGMVAYELLADGYPFDLDVIDANAFYHAVLTMPLPRPMDDINPKVRPVLERLLSKDPRDRFGNAGEVIAAFATAVDQSLAVETAMTRESFIQAAPLIDRIRALATLRAALDEAARGHGSTVLVGGESGIGKSRLLDELRTQALVDGVFVLRGQAVSRGGGPYHLWRDILSTAMLRVDVNNAEAEVLKAIVPNVSSILGREVGEAPVVDADAASTRLLFAAEAIFCAQPTPVLVIVEDLQWAGSESLRLFSWLMQPAAHLPLLLVGSFRDDEAPDLPAKMKGVTVLRLDRLPPEDITALGEAMIGPAARRRDVMQLLERETEGIPFFIVEVVRALGEHAGQLDRIGETNLPEQIPLGGIQKLLRRRLDQIPADAVSPLRTAAVVGREIDLPLMRTLHPELDLELWTTTCARTAVLELRDQRWRFVHDKLREQFVHDTPAPALRQLHGKVADAIERVYSGRPDYIPALAHHWRAADEPAREVAYSQQAGMLALQNGACREAVIYLLRAQELLQAAASGEYLAAEAPGRPSGFFSRWFDPNARVNPDGGEFNLGVVENELSEAHLRLGNLADCREHSERALSHFGQRVPSGAVGWITATARQAALRCLQMTLRVRAGDSMRAQRIAGEAARAQLRLTDMFFYSLRLGPLLWSSLRTLNQCEPAGPSPELARGYVLVALLAGAARINPLAALWARRALDIAESTGIERNVAWVLSRITLLQISNCRWVDADAGIDRAKTIAERVGDLRLWEETRAMAANVAFYSGSYEVSLARYRDAYRLSQRSGNRQVECWALLGQAAILTRVGRDAEAIGQYDAALGLIDETAMKTEALMVFGGLALSRLRTGDRLGAYQAADRALGYVRTMRPVAYWLQAAIAATAEVFLTLMETGSEPDGAARSTLGDRSREAVAGLRRFARHFPLGRPYACLWQGLDAYLAGRQGRAMRLWRRAIVLADRLQTPYESARARLEIGRHLPPEALDRRSHLEQAAALFEQLGCTGEVADARRELARGADVVCGEA